MARDPWSRPRSAATSRSSDTGCERAHSARNRPELPSVAPSSTECWHVHARSPSGPRQQRHSHSIKEQNPFTPGAMHQSSWSRQSPRQSPRVRLRFSPKSEKDARPLREGQIDLEIGVVGAFAPEVRMQSLFRDDFVGVVRIGHPLLSGTDVTPERYAACDHVVTSRKGEFTGPVDDALEELGLQRKTSVVVPGFPDAMRIARQSDLVALVPRQ